MNTLIPQPLSTRRPHAGAAPMHRTAPVPRSIEQAFGPYARRCQIVPMADPAEDERAHQVATWTAIAIGFVVVVILALEWFAGA